MPYLLSTRASIPLDADRVFAFFADASNLGRVTPPWLRFRIDTPPPIAMGPGTIIEYRLRLRGVPIHWRTEITEWDPPHRFVDEQRRGPYRWWMHAHTFTPGPDGTEMEDTVDYEPRGGALVHAVFVAPHLRSIFEYRHAALRDALGLPPAGRRPRVSIARR
jgi:ligand-binding SRPBCC domain-containing protein